MNQNGVTRSGQTALYTLRSRGNIIIL